MPTSEDVNARPVKRYPMIAVRGDHRERLGAANSLPQNRVFVLQMYKDLDVERLALSLFQSVRRRSIHRLSQSVSLMSR